MLRPLILAIDLLLWCVQGLIMLSLVVPLQRTAQVLTWASWKLIRWVYYPVVLLRRQITGKALWQDSDLTLGVSPPPSEIERLRELDAAMDRRRATTAPEDRLR